MVQPKMGIDYTNIIDVVPQQQIIKKQVQRDEKWVERSFIRIPTHGVDRFARGQSEIEKWCYEKYGSPVYLGPWCKVSGYIIMDEAVYTHWMLSK